MWKILSKNKYLNKCPRMNLSCANHLEKRIINIPSSSDLKMKKIGFFGDGIWAEKTLNKLLKIKNYKISFICLRFSNPDKNLIKIAKKNKIKFLVKKNIK